MADPRDADADADAAMWWSTAAAHAPPGRLGPARTRQAGWDLVAAELKSSTDPLAQLAVAQGFVARRRQALEFVSDAELRRRIRAGSWSVPRHGWLTPVPRRGDGRPDADSPEILIAATTLSRAGARASHESVAVLHGLPVLRPPRRVQLTVESVSHGGGWADCVLHAAPTPAAHAASWFGVPVHGPARAVVDVARRSGVAAGLVTADAALGEGLVTRADLDACLRHSVRWPGMVAARRVVELAATGAESPLESLARLCLVDGGVAEPLELQAELDTDRGTYRVDLLLRESRVVIEVDGRTKYAAPDALWREKQRQDALERSGWRIVRLTWADVTRRPDRTVARVLAAARRPAIAVF